MNVVYTSILHWIHRQLLHMPQLLCLMAKLNSASHSNSSPFLPSHFLMKFAFHWSAKFALHCLTKYCFHWFFQYYFLHFHWLVDFFQFWWVQFRFFFDFLSSVWEPQHSPLHWLPCPFCLLSYNLLLVCSFQ